MQIDWINFTPWASLAGGALIGIAAALFILFNGRIAGVSGILGGFLRPNTPFEGWRIAFIVGLILSPIIWQLFGQLPAIQVNTSYGLLIAAGLIVGASTSLGSGCTSGHGVCGISRLSPRSIIATLAFMATGFITVYVIRHIFGV